MYAKIDIPAGLVFDSSTFDDYFKLAVPLQKGQLSTREIINGLQVTKAISSNAPVTVNDVDGPYNSIPALRDQILQRGV